MPASPARIPTIDDRLRGYGTRRGSRKQKHTCSATRTAARTAKKAGARQLGPKKAIAQPQRQPCDYRSRIRPVTTGPRHVVSLLQLVRPHASYAHPPQCPRAGRAVAVGERATPFRAPASKAGQARKSRRASRRRSKHRSRVKHPHHLSPCRRLSRLRVRARAGRHGCSGDTVPCLPRRTMTCDEMRAFSKEHSHLDFPCARPIANMQWCNVVR